MKQIDKNKKKYIYFIIIMIACFLYLSVKLTYTSYESAVQTNAKSDVAGIQIAINGVDINNGEDNLTGEVLLDNLTWTNAHTRENKLSPGSVGTVSLEIDASKSDVAVMYQLSFKDKTIDSSKLLNFSSINCDKSLTRTAVDTYTGIITLDEIENNSLVHVNIDFYYDATQDINPIEEDTQNFSDLFEIYFHAVQYQGEAITPYSG